MIVRLTPVQIMMAAQVGVMRQVQNLKEGRRHRHGLTSNDNAWQIHIEGCLGEAAVALHMGAWWDGKIGDRTPGDVGDVEVRTTHHKNGCLILHDSDKDDSRFVLVRGIGGEYELAGWTYGSMGKVSKYWKDPKGGRPAYFIDAENLCRMESLA